MKVYKAILWSKFEKLFIRQDGQKFRKKGVAKKYSVQDTSVPFLHDISLNMYIGPFPGQKIG